jgi:hypothetical protein
MAIYTISTKKTAPDLDPRARHIDEWVRVADDKRNQVLGIDWMNQMELFYALTTMGGPMPSYRPLVKVPELQTLMMREANDLSEIMPRPYIINEDDGKRDKDREKGLQSEWARAQLNFHSMFTILMSLFVGTAPMQIGFNPESRNGKGALWAKMRPPDSWHPDPFTTYELDWSYVVVEDYMYLERVRKLWPDTSVGLKPRVAGRSVSPSIGDSGYGFQMPPGPMSMVPGMPNSRTLPNDNRVCVRWCFCEDYTRVRIEDKQLPDGAIVPADFEWKYPNGRLLVESEGRILQDGDNPYPLKMFPIIPFWSTLPLYGLWTIPAVRFSHDLQSLSERMWTQLYENAVRLNNGVWLIGENTGIDPEKFGGMPGEVQTINANSIREIECKFPPAFPQHFITLPQLLLDKQKELQGFTAARQGQPGAGNISPELFDASIMRSQGLTQLRGRLNAFTFQRIAEFMYYTMCRYYRPQNLSLRGDHDVESVEWKLAPRPDQYDVLLDSASIRALSQGMVQRMIPDLLKLGAVDKRTALEQLEFPDAGAVAERIERAEELAALARTRGVRR